MSLPNLDNLVKTGQLKIEPFNQQEFDGLLHSGIVRLDDAIKDSLSVESRFDLAYSAAHAFSLAVLRRHGYRSSNRYVVFQALPHTVGVDTEVWRILAKCHQIRNVAEYEGCLEIDEQLLQELLDAAQNLLSSIRASQVAVDGLVYLKNRLGWSDKKVANILHVSANVVNIWIKNGMIPANDSSFQAIIHLLAIHANLEAMFEDPVHQQAWLSTYHPELKSIPEELIMESIEKLVFLRQYLDCHSSS